MGFKEMGKWARGAMAGAALFGADAMHADAQAAAPKVEQQVSQESGREARDGELTSWVSDFGVKGLEVKRDGSKFLAEGVDVLVNHQQIGHASCEAKPDGGLRFTKETLRSTVAEILTEKGYRIAADVTIASGDAARAHTVERHETRTPLADEVSYRDQAKTMELMAKWGVVFDGYSLATTQDKKYGNDPLVATPGDPNSKITFSHDGESTIVITCYDKDGDINIIRVVEGSIAQ